MAYLVDTDVMVGVSRRNADDASYVDSLPGVWIAIVPAQELIVGARDNAMSPAPTVSFYAKSHGLRTFDSLIAATALESGLTLVTRNRKHFGMIDGIRLQGSGVLDLCRRRAAAVLGELLPH